MRTVAIVNQKGGSGKTTTAITLASILARRGQRTLLVDMDPQAHCALGFSVPSDGIDLSIADALCMGPDERPDRSRLIWRIARNLDLVPSTTKLAGLEAARGGLAEAGDREERLLRVLRPLADTYDWCLIDCSPSIGLLTFNALRAARFVLIPVETGYFALRGAERQIGALEALLRRRGEGATHGVFAAMHREETRVGRDVLEQLRSRFAGCLVPVVVRYDEALREAASLGVSVLDHAPESTAARDYTALAAWLLEHAPDGIALPPEGPGPESAALGNGDARAAAPGSEHHPDGAALEPVTSRVSVGGTVSRAAELAARARQLALRTARPDEGAGSGAGGVERLPEPARGIEAGAAATASAGDRPGLSPEQLTALYGARETSRGVLFVYPAGPDVEVCVAADINGWSPKAHRMRYNADLAAHEICIPFPRGRHPYRFVVNGQWITDPHNPRTAPNPFGQLDSIVEVGVAGRSR